MTIYVLGRKVKDDPTPIIYFPTQAGNRGTTQTLDYLVDPSTNPFVSNQSILG